LVEADNFSIENGIFYGQLSVKQMFGVPAPARARGTSASAQNFT
jgi:hypothetical protein